jgi:hypothetical protein
VNSRSNLLGTSERWLVPVVLALYVLFYLLDPQGYYALLWEDGLTEWATFVGLMAAGIVAALTVPKMRSVGDRRLWFLVLFAVGCILAGFEEISWGQRILNLESTEFFLEHSDSQEMNAHNVLQKSLDLKTKHVAGIVLLLYGVGLPILSRNSSISGIIAKWGFVVPPRRMMLSWLLAAIMMIDVPTGEEEELGEFLFSLCFLILAMGLYFRGTRSGVAV